MSNQDGTYTCAHEGCECRVADIEGAVRSSSGQIFCSEACKNGDGCGCEDCSCGSHDD